MSDPYHFGGEIEGLAGFTHLTAALAAAQTTAPQAVHQHLGHRMGAEKLCVALHEDQMALADAKSCRYLATASDQSCHSIFLRNPATSASVAAHLYRGETEGDFFKAVEKIAMPGAASLISISWAVNNALTPAKAMTTPPQRMQM